MFTGLSDRTFKLPFYLLLIAALVSIPLQAIAQNIQTYSGHVIKGSMEDLVPQNAAFFQLATFDGYDEKSFSVIYCKNRECPDLLNGVFGTNLTVTTRIGVRKIFDEKKIQVTGEWIGGDFYAHKILHTSTGEIRKGSIGGFGGLSYFSYTIDEQDYRRGISAVICQDNGCGGYGTQEGPTDKQTEDIEEGRVVTVTGYEAACIPAGGDFDVCTEIGTATQLSNPIIRGTGTIRQVDALGQGGISYIIDLSTGGSITTYACPDESCYQYIEDFIWPVYRTDLRQATATTGGEPKPRDIVRFYGEGMGPEAYLHAIDVVESANCDELEGAVKEAKDRLKDAERAEKSASKRLESAAKRADRRIATILKVQSIRLKRKERRKKGLEKAVERLTGACNEGNKRACRVLPRKQKNLADITEKIEAKKAKDAAKIASIEAGVDKFQEAYDAAVAEVDAAADALAKAEDELGQCQG